jgi:hypothetical protein
VLGDTDHGWDFPDGRSGSALALTAVQADGRPVGDVAIRFDRAPGGPGIVDLHGQKVRLARLTTFPWEDVKGNQGAHGVALRNADGQLLWGTLTGSLDEHGAEVLPEIRVLRLPSDAGVRQGPCIGAPGTTDMGTVVTRPARGRIDSLNERKIFHQAAPHRLLAIGCVEYHVGVQAVDVVSVDGCRNSEYMFQLHIIRRALLDPDLEGARDGS